MGLKLWRSVCCVWIAAFLGLFAPLPFYTTPSFAASSTAPQPAPTAQTEQQTSTLISDISIIASDETLDKI
ncbi:hypothetical protein, partial [Acetobacter orientalis]|uniref:hypothetical protein n=1 Tax=Acetobacter orientalis TaxID=146474 RepID=UPI0039EA77F3